MNNLEKKLDALIDALGFDIHEIPVPVREEDRGKFMNMEYNYRITNKVSQLDKYEHQLRVDKEVNKINRMPISDEDKDLMIKMVRREH